jgi:hypothetical protein
MEFRMANLEHGAEIYNQAADLIERIQNELADSRQLLISMGLDPEKISATIDSQISAEQRREAEAAFQQDIDAIEREVEAESLRLKLHTPALRPARGRHQMI